MLATNDEHAPLLLNDEPKILIQPLPRFYVPRRDIIKFMCLGAAMVCYIMRTNLAIAIRTMATELHWDDQMQGSLMASFFVGYVSTQFVGGYLAPRLGCKFMLGFSVFLPAMVTLITPFFVKYWYFLLFLRFLTGLGEGVMYPTFYEVSSKWWPVKEQATAWSFVSMGASLGTIVSFVAGAPELALLGWQGTFYVAGGLGVVWTALWMVFGANSAVESRIIHPAEAQYICDNLAVRIRDSIAVRRSPTWYVVKKLLRSAAAWAVLIQYLLGGWGFYVLLFYLPTYFSAKLHFDNTKSFLAAVLNPITAILMAAIGGLVLRHLQTKGVSNTVSIKVIHCVATVAQSSCILVAVLLPLPTWAEALVLGVGVGLNGFSAPALLANNALITPSYSTIFVGMTNTAANIPGIIGLYTTGSILQKTGSWTTVFLLSVICSMAAMLQFIVLGSSRKVV